METHVDSNGRGWFSHWPAADTKASVIVPAAGANKRQQVDAILWGLDKAPAAALELTLSLGTTVVLTLPLPAAGLGNIELSEILQSEPNESVTIEISGDSGGAVSYLNVAAHAIYSP